MTAGQLAAAIVHFEAARAFVGRRLKWASSTEIRLTAKSLQGRTSHAQF
jgi:hypothetical protein